MTFDRVRPPRRGVSVEWLALWVILVLAFALSFRALFDVGQAAGLGSLSWALPVIVDGFAVLAARVIERLESKWARLYPWALLIGLVGVSSWWNALHAGGEVVLDPYVAAVVAGAPPVVLGLAYHLLRMVPTARQRADGASDCCGDGCATARIVDSGAAISSNGVPSAAQRKAHRSDVVRQRAGGGGGSGAARPGTVRDRAWRWYVQQRQEGHEPGAPELARAVGTSPGNARKLIAVFKRQWTETEPALIGA